MYCPSGAQSGKQKDPKGQLWARNRKQGYRQPTRAFHSFKQSSRRHIHWRFSQSLYFVSSSKGDRRTGKTIAGTDRGAFTKRQLRDLQGRDRRRRWFGEHQLRLRWKFRLHLKPKDRTVSVCVRGFRRRRMSKEELDNGGFNLLRRNLHCLHGN
jgi:hypothetical protein